MSHTAVLDSFDSHTPAQLTLAVRFFQSHGLPLFSYIFARFSLSQALYMHIYILIYTPSVIFPTSKQRRFNIAKCTGELWMQV